MIKVKDENEEGYNGVNWLYKNWDKIIWKKTGSNLRDTKLNVISKTKKGRDIYR